MDETDARSVLERIIRERGENYGALSRLIGRNPAYIQQYVKRGTPRKLDEEDRRTLAKYLGVDERMLGAPEEESYLEHSRRALAVIPRLLLGASAGAGTLDADEAAAGAFAFDPRWLRRHLGVRPESLSIIRVDGESMAPTLAHGDDIMVDRSDGAERLRDGIYVLRLDDALMVKRVAMTLRRDRLSVRSDNPAYPDWDDVDPASVTIVGRVVWTSRRLA